MRKVSSHYAKTQSGDTMNLQIPLPTDENIPLEVQEQLLALPPLNLFRMLANAPASFKGFCDYGFAILFDSQFDPRKREIAILRVAHVTHSIYEWTQHVALAKTVAVTDEEIEKIACEGAVTTLDEEGNLLCRVADEMSRDVRLSDDALSQILGLYGSRGATELIVCVSWFNCVSRILESTRVPLEEEDVLTNELDKY
jgi:4-carboxymuconolactone decarboxylase